MYAAVGVPLQIAFAAVTAYLVARFCHSLGLSRAHAVWALVLYGLASPALTYTRGDYAQPLLGLCWIAGLYAAYLHVRTGAGRQLMLAAGAVFAAVLTRAVEGLLLLPAVMLIVGWRSAPSPLPAIGGALLAGIATVAINLARYGSLFSSGYSGEGWTSNPAVGLAGLLVSPGRGLVWAFPAVLLVPFGARALYRLHRPIVVVLSALSIALLLIMSGWHAWWGA